jgi:hypothetical protein
MPSILFTQGVWKARTGASLTFVSPVARNEGSCFRCWVVLALGQ